MKNYMFWIKKRRASYEEARTIKIITRDTVLSFAYDNMYITLM